MHYLDKAIQFTWPHFHEATAGEIVHLAEETLIFSKFVARCCSGAIHHRPVALAYLMQLAVCVGLSHQKLASSSLTSRDACITTLGAPELLIGAH